MNSKQLDRLIKEALNEKLSDARSEIGYSKNRKSRKPQKKAYNKASRRDSQRDIEIQATESPLTYLDTATIADLVPIGRDAFDALDGEIPYENPSTGERRTFSKKTDYLDSLADDYIFGDVDMAPNVVERLAELSPEFASSLENYEHEHRDFEDRGYDDMNESDDKFGRGAIRDFFRDTLYDELESTPRTRSRDSAESRMLTEAVEDHSPPSLDDDQVNRLAQAIVTGLNLEFDIDASGPTLIDLEEQVQYHLAKYPELPAILYDIAYEARFADDVGPDSNYDSVSSADGPTRDEMIELIAGHVLDAKTDGGWTGIFDESAMMEFVTAMRDNGDIDIHDWNNHTIDAKEVRDRVAELEAGKKEGGYGSW